LPSFPFMVPSLVWSLVLFETSHDRVSLSQNRFAKVERFASEKGSGVFFWSRTLISADNR
jgi:hypothetical protein